MSELYKEYIKVEKNFEPVFAATVDENNPEKWKSFYPHESFKRILTLTLDSLEKSSATKNRSIWISGTYGTGKTFTSFVIKHILEDDLKTVEEYFKKNNLDSFYNRLEGIRQKGKILVVHQSSSAGINSQNKLFNSMTEAVKRALKKNGYTYKGAASMLEKVLQTLKDKDSAFNFQAAFRKYRGRFSEYENCEEIISDLETLNEAKKLTLLDEIVEVAEAESYNWSMSPQSMIDWLKDIRQKNNLYAIFFIWDEFTEYFRNNVNNITGLQEIAQASADMSFYFFLITHSNYEQLITDEKQRRIIRERFKPEHITLPENTAFQLMGQALKVEPDLKNEWEKISRELSQVVQQDSINHIIARDATITQSNITKLIPMHPYSSYLLKFISQDINSNQRTMFQFLCADYSPGDERKNFKWFIDNNFYEYGAWNFLTVDYLWDYFFNLDDPDLDKIFQEAIIYYNNFESICKNDNQRRLLKATLILFALQSKNIGSRTKGATSLLRSTQKNILACFAGTPFANEVNQTLNFFAAKNIVTAIPESNDVYYLMATTQVDNEKMENLIKLVKREKNFDALIKDDIYGVVKTFKPSANYLKQRLDVKFITPTKFLQVRYEDLTPDKNQILVFYIFAFDEEEQGKVNQAVQKIYEKYPERCIVADFSGLPFTSIRYEKFVQNKAKELYFKDIPNQREQMKLAAKTAADIVEEWNRQFSVATVRIFTSAENSVQLKGEINFSKKIEELNFKIFPCGLETISKNDNLFDPQGFKETVAKYALGIDKIPGGYNYLYNLENSFKQIEGRTDEKYWEKNPAHPISKIKIIIEEFVKKSFEKKSAVYLTDIWDTLKKPPVGLMKCKGTLYLLTLLFKDYADSVYYTRDVNNNTQSLKSAKLADLLSGTIKELPTVRGISLVKQTPEHIKFCKIIGNIFNLSGEEKNSIDDVAKNVNRRLTQKIYPVWALKYYVKEAYNAVESSAYLNFINLLDEFINPQNTVNAREKTKIADDIYRLSENNSNLEGEMKKIAADENFRSGMIYYIAQYKPDFIKITEKLKIDSAEYLARLSEKLSSDSAYIWKIEDLNKQIDRLFLELKLVYALNEIFSEPQKNFSNARQELSEKLNRIKIPRPLAENIFPELKNIFKIFVDIRSNTIQDFEQARRQIELDAETFKNFFDEQSVIFSSAAAQYFNKEIDENILNCLYDKIPRQTFFTSVDDFWEQVAKNLNSLRHNEKLQKFFELWKKLTKTDSPADWSNKNEIPILCVFQNYLMEAQSCFDLLNNKNYQPDDEKLDAALRFLKRSEIKLLQDNEYCETAFINCFGGEEYSCVLDVESLREVLRDTLGDDVYSWYLKRSNCQQQIKNLAESNFFINFVDDVRDKILKMSAEQAKAFLINSIENDALFGIRLLKNS